MTMTLDVVNQQNEKIGSLDLRDEVFGGRVKTDLIHDRSCARTPPSDAARTPRRTARRSAASGKKPWRQKGTGRARVGEIRNPLWRKGGTVFGPQPRSYEYHLPRKVEKGALRAALAQKLRDGAVIVVDALTLGEIKTRAAAEMLRRLGVDGKALLVDVKPEDKLRLSVRNIEGVRAAPEQPDQRARRGGHATRGADARRAGEAAGGAGLGDRIPERLGDRDETDRRASAVRSSPRRRRSSARMAGRWCSRCRATRTRSTSTRGRAAARREGRQRPHLAGPRQDEAAGPVRRAGDPTGRRPM